MNVFSYAPVGSINIISQYAAMKFAHLYGSGFVKSLMEMHPENPMCGWLLEVFDFPSAIYESCATFLFG